MLNVEIDVSQIAGAEEAFKRAPALVKKHMKAAMLDSQLEVLKGAFDRVHVITGKLRQSLSYSRPPEENAQGGFTGTVGIAKGSPAAKYAAMEEFGFQGTQIVRAFQRSTAFGRPTQSYTVPSHTRFVNRKEHPYLRPALAAARDAITKFHEQAITDTIAEMNLGGAA